MNSKNLLRDTAVTARGVRLAAWAVAGALGALSGVAGAGPDVIVGDLPNISDYGTSGTRHAYAVGTTPFGPFERVGKILQQDPSVATGAGHHSVLQSPRSGKWYIVYHRRPLGEKDRNHRVVCIDELRFDEKGMIQPVVITSAGVGADPF